MVTIDELGRELARDLAACDELHEKKSSAAAFALEGRTHETNRTILELTPTSDLEALILMLVIGSSVSSARHIGHNETPREIEHRRQKIPAALGRLVEFLESQAGVTAEELGLGHYRSRPASAALVAQAPQCGRTEPRMARTASLSGALRF